MSFDMEEPVVNICQHDAEMIEKLTIALQKASDMAFMDREFFYIGISGGTVIKYLKEALPNVITSYSKWKIFFNDERIVPEDSEDSTYGTCKRTLIGCVQELNESCFVPIKQGVTVQEAAEEYIMELIGYFPPGSWPRFDLLLLGMGPDGHTCSLFPGHPVLNEKSLVVAAITDSPKPPPERITFTLLVLNSAANVVFIVTGIEKADAIKRVLIDEDEELPATRVQPRKGSLSWIIDQSAAKHIITDYLQ